MSLEILYAVNAKMPNSKAHGIQIVKTCEALAGRGNTVSLIIAGKARGGTDVFTFYNLERNFSVVRLPVIDTTLFGHVVQFYLRSVSFYVSLYPFLFFRLLKNALYGAKSIVYVRGEAILILAPVFFFTTLVWESHTLRGHKSLYRALLPLLSGMVVITDAYKRDLVATKKIRDARIAVARDAVDIEEFDIHDTKDEARKSLGLPQNKTIVLYTGQLSEHKGVDTLLKSSEYLPDEYLMVIVGGKEAEVARYKERYGTAGIQFAGLVPHGDIPRYLKAADMLVLPDSALSDYGRLHTSPMKMFEYMASRRPILASNVPSLGEVLNEKNAMMFVPDNANDLAEKMQVLRSDPVRAERLSMESYRTVQEFTWAKRALKIETFLHTV